MDVFASRLELFAVSYAMVGKASLPDGEFRADLMRKAAFDESNSPFQGNLLRR